MNIISLLSYFLLYRKIPIYLLLLISIPIYLQAQIFTEIPCNIKGLMCASSQWGDYDNDGDLDIILTVETNTHIIKTEICRNDFGKWNKFF